MEGLKNPLLPRVVSNRYLKKEFIMANSKKLKMVFLTDAKTNLNVIIPDPKEGLTLANAKEAAKNMIPVLMNTKGARAESLKSAVLVTTTEEELQ